MSHEVRPRAFENALQEIAKHGAAADRDKDEKGCPTIANKQQKANDRQRNEGEHHSAAKRGDVADRLLKPDRANWIGEIGGVAERENTDRSNASVSPSPTSSPSVMNAQDPPATMKRLASRRNSARIKTQDRAGIWRTP